MSLEQRRPGDRLPPRRRRSRLIPRDAGTFAPLRARPRRRLRSHEVRLDRATTGSISQPTWRSASDGSLSPPRAAATASSSALRNQPSCRCLQRRPKRGRRQPLRGDRLRRIDQAALLRRPSARFRRRCRCALARLPQTAMLHQRRRCALLASRKSQPHPAPAHSRTRFNCGEVKRSDAERAIIPSNR